ncbi:putative N-acetyltransferase YjaB [bioreactor metagenome]|uniref:Putative N-acetyltransferase YjaB n=1 Tax=bioreactor metagenome TaxID=1076179 RepID=A0A644WWL4_9ZZZZ
MIRDFRPEDIDDVMRLWLDTNILAHDFIDSGYWRANFEAVKKMIPKAAVFVYEQDGDIRAFIGLMESFIAGIFVSNDFQSKGIGKLLLDHTKDKHGELSLNVYKKNSRAIRFYSREGFIISAEQTDENTGETELIMKWKK